MKRKKETSTMLEVLNQMWAYGYIRAGKDGGSEITKTGLYAFELLRFKVEQKEKRNENLPEIPAR